MGDNAKKNSKKVRTIIHDMYWEVWSDFNRIMGERKLRFADRLKQAYNIRPYNIVQYKARIRRTHQVVYANREAVWVRRR